MLVQRSEDIRPRRKHGVLEEVSGDEDTEEGAMSCVGSRWGAYKEKPPSQLLRFPSMPRLTAHFWDIHGDERKKDQFSTLIYSSGHWLVTLQTTPVLSILLEERSAPLFCADKCSKFMHL